MKLELFARDRAPSWLWTLLLPSLTAMLPNAAQAAGGTWNVLTGTGSWASYGSWNPAANPVPGNTAGDVLDFSTAVLTAATTVQLDGNRTVGTINISPSAPAAGFGYTFAGNNTGGYLIFDNGVGNAALNFLSSQTTPAANNIYAPIILSSNLEISSTNTAVQGILGSITGTGSITVDSNGAHLAVTNSIIGQIAFGGVNSYSGGTIITEARVESRSNWAFGTGKVTVNNGGGVGLFGGGYYKNDFDLTGLGWNESATGGLGAIRTEGTTVFNGTLNMIATGVAPTVRLSANNAAATLLYNGVMTGGANIEFGSTTASTAVTHIVNNTNTHTGAMFINRVSGATGTALLQIGNNNTSGALGAGDITIGTGGTLVFNRTDNITIANQILAGAGGLSQIGLGQTTLSNANILHAGASTVSGFNSRLTLGTGGALNLAATNGNYTLTNFADLQFNTSSNININSSINGARGAYLIQDSANTLTLSGLSDNSSGRVILNSGTVVFGKTGVAPHAIGAAYVQYGLIQNGGTVQLVAGSGNDQIFDQTAIRLNRGTLDLNANAETMGTLTGPGGVGSAVITNTNGGAATITFGGVSSAMGIFADNNTIGGSTVLHTPDFGGTIDAAGGIINVAKANTGLQILSGANTYTGTTTVSGGLLSVTGSLSAAGTVNTSGGSLAGTGTVGNIVQGATAGQGVRPGATGQDRDAVANLNAASLTVNGGDLRLNFGASGNDTLTLTGAANFTAASTVTPVFSSAPAAGVSTIVIGGAPATMGTAPTVNLPANSRITGGTILASGNNVTLTLAGASAQAHAWTGGTSTVWDPTVPAATNWTSTDTLFQNLDSVSFGNTGAGTVSIGAGGVVPSGITVNATANYIFNGGAISGGGGINKSGSGTLTVNTANTFTGDVNITEGMFVLGNAGALGDGTGQTFVSNGGTLDINGIALSPLASTAPEIVNISGTGVGGLGALVNNSVTGQQNALRFLRLTGDATVGVGNAASRFDIRGSGTATTNELLDLQGFTLSKTGPGLFVITQGVSVTDGNLTVNQGTLSIETNTLIQGIGTITANAGGTLAYWTTVNGNITRPNVWNGGTITNLATNSTVNSSIALTANSTLIGTGATLTFGGNLAESGGSFGLTKNEGSAYNFAGNVNYSGATTVNQGTLTLGGLNAASSSAVNSVTASGAATLGTALAPAAGGTQGNLNFGGGGYTTIATAPSAVTINNGTLGINTRVSQNFASPVTNIFNGGTNTISVIGVEQDTTISLTGASIGNSTQYGVLAIGGGTVNVGAGTALNLRSISMTAQGGNVAGANMGILNITGGNHKVAALYLGDGSNAGSIVNMSGGTLNFEQVGNASLQSTNNSGVAVGGVSGLRIGHFSNGNAPGSIVNLSGGTIDASKVTVSVGWDGAGFLNVTGGTLKARTLVVDGSGASALPIINRMDVSGGARIEIGHGGMPTVGTNSAINVGNSTWVAVESSDWTRGMSLNATGATTTTFENVSNRLLMSGQLAGNGNLTKTGNGIMILSGANVNTGGVTINAGLLRMGNVQALGDGTITVANGATLDASASNGAGIAVRPSSITLGGAGLAGSLGSLINSSATTAGIGTDTGGTITLSADTISYAVGRLELGANTDSVINGGTNSFTKNGQGNFVWRGTSATTLGNIILNGGTFYSENSNNNLGATGNVTVNRGAILSTFNANTQSKPVVLNGGALFGDSTVNHIWNGGLTLTADSLQTRGGIGTVTIDNASLDLGGFTLTKRDRGTLTFQNNTSSGNGNLNIIAGTVNIGANSTFGGSGSIKVGGDANLTLDATANLTKSIMLAGGLVGDTATSRSLTVDSTGNGGIGALNPGGTIALGNLKVLGSTAYSSNAGLMIGSGNGFVDSATAGTSVGAVTLTNTGILLNNPNFTVSSNPSATTNNDTTFARWDGAQVTGVAPTSGNINTALATDVVMQTVAPGAAITVDQTIGSLITDVGITITGATLKLNDGGIIVREAAAAGWSGTGSLTSGRVDGVLALTTANGFDQTLPLGGGNVGAFTVGNISNNTISAAPTAFRPVVLVKNGNGNIGAVANQAYTGGTIINGGRINLGAQNGLGLGSITVREGGTLLAGGGGGFSNNISAAGVGLGENAGVLGAIRFAASAPISGTTTLNGLTRLHTHGGDVGIVLGNIAGTTADSLEKTGSGNLIVRSSATYTGATTIGNAGGNLSNGTYTAFNLANGGSASAIGAASNAASNLMFHSGTMNYIGGGASTDRLFTIAAALANSAGGVASSVAIANNGYGNLAFTNPGAIATQGSNDATLTLTANNYTANTFTPSLANPVGSRLNVTVNGPGSWEFNGSAYDIGGTVTLSGGADLILNTPADLTIPILVGASNTRSILVKNGSNTLTLGGSGLLAEADNGAGQLTVNAGTVIFDKRGANGYTAGAIVGAGSTGRISALGASGPNAGDGLVINGGTVRYATTANMDQLFDTVDVRINAGTLDFNGRSDAFDSLNGTGGKLTNGLAGSLSQIGIGNSGSVPSALNFRALASYAGVIEDGAGQVELIKIGSGVQELTATNTYTGKTSIASGLLRISSEANLGANPSTFDLSHLILSGGGLETSANVTIDDVNRGVWLQNGTSPMRPDAGTNLTFATAIAGVGTLEAVGLGTVTLAGSNIFTGSTSAYRGTLVLDYTTNNTSKLADGAALIMRGGSVVLNGGTHVEAVGSTTIDGNGNNAGASYLALSGGRTAAINLNGITRANGTIGGTLDINANGIATTDTTNNNGIITGATGGGNSGVAYATVGKTNWAVNSTNGADGPINGLATYSNTNALTSHLDPVAGSTAVGVGLGATLRFNQAAGSSITGTSLVLNQQGILMTPAAGASSIDVTTLTGFASPTAAVTSDLVVHQHSANDLTISSIIANTVSGTFTNTTGLTKSGVGKLILTGANTATGTTHINEGTLELQGAGVLGANVAANAVWVDGTLSLNPAAGAMTINNNMGGNGVILKKGTGIATLTGGIGTYSGDVMISQGTLVSNNAAQFNNANAINDRPEAATTYGTLTLGDANTGSTDPVRYLNQLANTVRKNIVVTNTGSSGEAVIGAGTGAAAAGGVAVIYQGNVQMNRATILRGDGTDRTTFQGVLSGNVGTLTIDAPNVAAVAINTNPGRVTLENSNTFIGDVVVNGAILQVGTGAIGDPQDQIPDASNVTLNGVSATKQAGLTLNGDSETINNLNGDVNTFIQSAASSSATGMRLTVNGTGTFSGVFNAANNNGMTLEKAGSGTFTLAGTADNNSGRVLVTSGTLQLAKTSIGGFRAVGADSVIQGGTLLLGGTGGDQIFDSASLTMYGGTFDLGGTNETVASIFSNTGIGTITNSGATVSTLTLGGNNTSSLLGATIQNGTSNVALSKVGTGGAVLTGTNPYTGATTITAGYIQLGNGGTTGSISTTSSVVTSANTQLVFNRSDNVSFAPVISGAGGLVQNGGGILEVPAGTTNSYSGPTVVNAGELKVNGSIFASSTTLNPGTILSGSGVTGPIGSLGGSIRPGNSPGVLTTGSIVADAGTSFVYEINGAAPGTGYDQLQVNGILSLGTTSLFTLTASYTPDPNVDRFWLIANDGVDAIQGQFVGIPEGLTVSVNGMPYYYTYQADSGTNQSFGGNDFALVPEPTGAVLMMLGSVGLLRRRRRA